MVPEPIRVIRPINSQKLGILPTLCHHSMSLRDSIRDGEFPPLAVFNHFMACGFDDAASDIGYLNELEKGGATIEWEPFSVTAEEHSELVNHIISLGHPIRILDMGVNDFGEWFTKCHN